MAQKIRIVEVGPRDGLQNEKENLSPEKRAEFVKRLGQTGLKAIEIAAFVSPKWVPQMAGSEKVVKQTLKTPVLGVQYSAIVPNLRGFEDALKSGIKEVAIFGAASESFSRANINCSIKESFARFEDVVIAAKKNKIKVRGYLSTVFACPFEGKVSVKRVVQLVEKFLEMGVYEVSLGDTIGVATPKDVENVLQAVKSVAQPSQVAMHFHDTRGTALANASKSLDLGVFSFDSSLGGLGGCPYAPMSTGNLATEDLVYLLHGMGFKTGIDLARLIEVNHWMSTVLKRQLPSRVSRAGIFQPRNQ